MTIMLFYFVLATWQLLWCKQPLILQSLAEDMTQSFHTGSLLVMTTRPWFYAMISSDSCYSYYAHQFLWMIHGNSQLWMRTRCPLLRNYLLYYCAFTDGFPEAAELFFFLTFMTAGVKDQLICNWNKHHLVPLLPLYCYQHWCLPKYIPEGIQTWLKIPRGRESITLLSILLYLAHFNF